jgi:SET domain-containing protein
MGSRFRPLNAAINPCALLQSKRRSDNYVTAVVARRDIMDGEEITVSYGQTRTAMEEDDFIL